MAAPAIAARLLAMRNLRKLLGCGCIGAISIVLLPLFMLFSMVSGMLSGLGGGSAGGNQVDGLAAGSADLVVGAGEPLAAGRFSVSQGFGCTTVTAEPPPRSPYTCPPDLAHSAAVRFHSGIDLAADVGLPVFAVVAGTVHVINSQSGFGVHILLMPTAATAAAALYLYGHLSGVAVPDGDVVRAGEPIAFVGSTGNSTGPHLHFEVDVHGIPVNPCSTFPAGYLAPAGVAAADCLAWAP